MKTYQKLLLANGFLVVFFLFYLCVIDIVFVFIMEQQPSLLNKFIWLVFTMPFLGSCFSMHITKKWQPVRKRISISLITFLILTLISYVELIWVAISFHTMIGGSI